MTHIKELQLTITIMLASKHCYLNREQKIIQLHNGAWTHYEEEQWQLFDFQYIP